ncbi:MAG: anti-sigma F factor [Erysipelotrichaceae bacterium]|nr:anti-sigma F factor [Erysipelotrichaceae bacterium]
MSNSFELKFKATLSNELLARNSLTSFLSPYNLGLDEISEFKTIVSEAVSNAIIHGYKFDSNKYVYMKATIFEDEVEIIIKDYGVGIENVKEARVPHYTSRPDLERAGMGLTIIDSLSDSFNITSIVGVGVKLIIKKKFHPVVING